MSEENGSANYKLSYNIALGPLLAITLLLFDLSPANPLATRMAAIVVWMAVWWLTDVVHHAVTALIPIVFIPLMGILDTKTTAMQYTEPIVFLFIGGFIIAFAIERWNLHQRIALRILMMVGSSPSKILFGVMLSSFLISMWISNTATTMMLLSAVLAVIYQAEKYFKADADSKNFAVALLIGLSYSATIGGMATPVGTPTNMIFMEFYKKTFAESLTMNFFEWFKIGFPIAVAFLLAAYFVLRILFVRNKNKFEIEKDYFKTEYAQLGKITYEEKMVALVFSITALLWFTRANIDFGYFTMKGWSNLFSKSDFISDTSVAMLMSFILFVIPSKNKKGEALITWKEASKLPFDIVLLFGGGFAMAKGIEVSGLSGWIASQLNFLSGVNIVLFIFLMCVIITIISEFASNVACIQLMLPVLVAVQSNMDVQPLTLLLPATLAASLGFMLPVATAPNTIVFGTHKIKINQMLKAGFYLDLIGIVLITILASLIN